MKSAEISRQGESAIFIAFSECLGHVRLRNGCHRLLLGAPDHSLERGAFHEPVISQNTPHGVKNEAMNPAGVQFPQRDLSGTCVTDSDLFESGLLESGHTERDRSRCQGQYWSISCQRGNLPHHGRHAISSGVFTICRGGFTGTVDVDAKTGDLEVARMNVVKETAAGCELVIRGLAPHWSEADPIVGLCPGVSHDHPCRVVGSHHTPQVPHERRASAVDYFHSTIPRRLAYRPIAGIALVRGHKIPRTKSIRWRWPPPQGQRRAPSLSRCM